jgi:hypothetical protein
LPSPVKEGQGMVNRQMGLADRLRCLRANRQGSAIGEFCQDAAHAGRPGPDKMPPHAIEDVAERFTRHIPKGQGDQVAWAKLAASIDIDVREPGAAAEGVFSFEVGEGGQDRKVVTPGSLISCAMPATRAPWRFTSSSPAPPAGLPAAAMSP